jgi:hypothetical protein
VGQWTVVPRSDGRQMTLGLPTLRPWEEGDANGGFRGPAGIRESAPAGKCSAIADLRPDSFLRQQSGGLPTVTASSPAGRKFLDRQPTHTFDPNRTYETSCQRWPVSKVKRSFMQQHASNGYGTRGQFQIHVIAVLCPVD